MQSEHDGRTDFDFFIGRWKAHNQRLRERLKGSTEWDEIEGVAVVRKVLAESRQWSMYWVSSADGILQPPVIGGFENGQGEFYSQELFEGKTIFCRFICCNITQTSCRWEQAFSIDGGKTWETNWISELTREN